MITGNVLATLDYVRKFSGTKIVVKLGGSVLEDKAVLNAVCEDLAAIRKVGVSILLVHGGGPAINQELTSKGISWTFVEGQRVTTPEMMQVIEMVLVGKINREIVRNLNKFGVKAVGLSGADAGTLICKRASPALGQVGHIEKVNTGLLNFILGMEDDLGFRRGIPVLAPIGFGKDDLAYNINADWVASRVAAQYGVVKMVFLTDQDGILDSNGKLIPELDAGELEQLIEDQTVKGGMLAKTRTILHALSNGVTDVHIINAGRPGALIEELFTDRGSGTICRMRSRRASGSDIKGDESHV